MRKLKSVPILQNKQLADGVIETLRQALETELTWLEMSFPSVQVGYYADGSTYPQCYTNQSIESQDLSPDASLTSYCFFEKGNYSMNLNGDGLNEYNLSVVFWCNLSLINSGTYEDFSDELKNDVCNVLINNDCTNLIINNLNPFEKYKLKEVNNQYFMRPYLAFKIDFKILKFSC